MNTQKISHTMPKPIQSTSHTLQSTQSTRLVRHTPLRTLNPIHLLTQTLRTTPAGISSQHLISNIIITLQFRITPTNLIPNRSTPHQTNNILPLLGISRTQSLCPQMSILMNSSLTRSNMRVDINLTANSKAISLATLSLEKPHLVHNLSIILIEDNIIPRTILAATTPVLGRIFNARKAHLRQSLRSRIIRTQKMRQHLIHFLTPSHPSIHLVRIRSTLNLRNTCIKIL